MKYDPTCEFSRQNLALSIISRLEEAGFKEDHYSAPGVLHEFLHELVYKFPIKGTNLSVKIFTSVVRDTVYGLIARREGKDAIRVNVSSPDVRRAIISEKRVNRTGQTDNIVERMLDRARDAYRLGRQSGNCHMCGAPRAMSKGNKWYCAQVCWKTDEEKRRDSHMLRARRKRTSIPSRRRRRF